MQIPIKILFGQGNVHGICTLFKKQNNHTGSDIRTKKMKTGIELITEERAEQLSKHKRTIEQDVNNNDSEELICGAIALLNIDFPDEIIEGRDISKFPSKWDKSICQKMANKSYKERLIISGALIAAEIDRLQADEVLIYNNHIGSDQQTKKIEIVKTEHYVEVNGQDNNGAFKIRIQKDCSQLQLESEISDSYIDVNHQELKTIRDAITDVLDGFSKCDA